MKQQGKQQEIKLTTLLKHGLDALDASTRRDLRGTHQTLVEKCRMQKKEIRRIQKLQLKKRVSPGNLKTVFKLNKDIFRAHNEYLDKVFKIALSKGLLKASKPIESKLPLADKILKVVVGGAGVVDQLDAWQEELKALSEKKANFKNMMRSGEINGYLKVIENIRAHHQSKLTQLNRRFPQVT